MCACISVFASAGEAETEVGPGFPERQEPQPLPLRSFQADGTNMQSPCMPDTASVLEELTGDKSKTGAFKQCFQVAALSPPPGVKTQSGRGWSQLCPGATNPLGERGPCGP